MDPFHQRLAQVALDAATRYGFCLAGGYAVQAHGFVDRVSKDVDLFTTMAAASDFPAAQADVIAALRADGLEVNVEREGASFARLTVTDPAAGSTSTVEFGCGLAGSPTGPAGDRPGTASHRRSGEQALCAVRPGRGP